MTLNHTCPLCHHPQPEHFAPNYSLCKNCSYVFLNRDQLLALDEEKKIYDFHQNDPSDEGYIKFLSQIIEPLKSELAISFADKTPIAKLQGLDFGCGPGPAMHTILDTNAYVVSNYDPIYYPNEKLLERDWDFIVSTEVFEHLHTPKGSFEHLMTLLKPGGVLAIMTLMTTDDLLEDHLQFEKWFYKNDPTHVGFFHRKSFAYLAKAFNLELRVWNHRCITLRKKISRA